MNPTSIDFCGPWQPINDTISSQAGFDFDTVNKAPGHLDVSGSVTPDSNNSREFPIFLSGVSIGVRGYMFRQAVP